MKPRTEVQAIAERNGWKVGPLTIAAINRMSSLEVEFHEKFNTAEFNRALNEPKAIAESKATAEAEKTKRLWTDQATPEDTESALEEVAIFCQAFPQFVGSHLPNREALVEWLRMRNLPVTARNLVTAFQALGADGKLLLNPSAIGVGTETEISGARLKNHPKLWVLLEPAQTIEAKERQEMDQMSASDWRQAHPEAFRENRVHPLQQRAWRQAIDTFRLSNPTYTVCDANRVKMLDFITANGLQINVQGLQAAFNALKARGELELQESAQIEGQAVRHTDFGDRERGLQLPEKPSLAWKINSLSAAEYARWIANPANREAVDRAITV